MHSLSRALGPTAASAIVRFIGEPASARPLAAIRIGLAAVLLLQAVAFAPNLFLFFGSRGIVQAPIASAVVSPALPRITYFADVLAPWIHDERVVLLGCFALYVLALHLLLIGWCTRAAAIVAWLLQLSLKTSGIASAYGVFEFATIGLFYCAVMPCGDAISADSGSLSADRPSAAARLGLRVVQIHLCIVYLTSGLQKAQGEQWRNGEALWRSVLRPRFQSLDLSWLAWYPALPLVMCWATLVIELGYAFLVWPYRTRRAWAMAAIAMHAGIAVMLGLWSFSGVMIVLSAAAFLVPAAAHSLPITHFYYASPGSAHKA